jgi:hypothetical protein
MHNAGNAYSYSWTFLQGETLNYKEMGILVKNWFGYQFPSGAADESWMPKVSQKYNGFDHQC